jgi:hypothetical protein
MRTIITPGRLYAKLSDEFRQVARSKCTQCVLPLPYRVDEPGEGPTWVLGPPSRECEECARVLAEIVRDYQARYDLLDPITPPVSLNRKPAPRFQRLH